MSPADRQRLATLPPRPVADRVTTLEYAHDDIRDDISRLSEVIEKQTAKIDAMNKHIEDLTRERTAKERRREWWLKVLAGVTTTLLIAAGGWIAAVVNTVQHARLSP